jgi:predicted nucleic acid-binding protein
VSEIILLDAGPLGWVTNPRLSPVSYRCTQWMEALMANGVAVLVPEIADYEVRRELLRAQKRAGLARLDALKAKIGYAPITTEVMLLAAEFWAQARRQGRPTTDDRALDGDVILAAQAVLLGRGGDEVVIATTNAGHLGRFVDARNWEEITLSGSP